MINDLTVGDITIDCTDPIRSREFYSKLMDWEQVVAFGCPALRSDSGLTILFVKPDPPVWPEEDCKQQKQMHFNFQVDDLPATINEAIRLGATKASTQFGAEHFVTMLEPGRASVLLLLFTGDTYTVGAASCRPGPSRNDHILSFRPAVLSFRACPGIQVLSFWILGQTQNDRGVNSNVLLV
jgi:hypothetical protein